MARPTKTGLDYFPLDVSIDDNLELIEAEFGMLGFAVVIKLWQKIYKNGYYCEWNEDSLLLFSKKINTEITVINSVINSCFRRSLFDQEMFDKYQILTSSGIQKRYITACSQSKRKKISLIKQFLLVNSEFTGLTTELTELNQEESTQSKVKESKVKESTPLPPTGEPIDFNKLIFVYHEKCPNLPKVEIVSKARKAAIKARVNEHGKKKVIEMFEKAGRSKFLNGNNDKNWTANFDWLFNPKNFVKILEGNYEKTAHRSNGLAPGQVLHNENYKPKVKF